MKTFTFLHTTFKLAMASVFSLAMLSAGVNSVTAATPDGLTTEQFKTIAEQGFIYGLPLVMNYAIMNEYAVDPNSSQFKAPFNQIKNLARVFTYKDTAVVTANSDTPYSFLWLDLRAEPMVLSVPAVPKDRYYLGDAGRCPHLQLRLYGSRATGSKAGKYMVVGPDWKGEKPAGIDKVFQSLTPFSFAAYRTQLINADRHAQRGEDPGPVQGRTAVGIPGAAGPGGRAGSRFPASHHRRHQGELLELSRRRA